MENELDTPLLELHEILQQNRIVGNRGLRDSLILRIPGPIRRRILPKFQPFFYYILGAAEILGKEMELSITETAICKFCFETGFNERDASILNKFNITEMIGDVLDIKTADLTPEQHTSYWNWARILRVAGYGLGISFSQDVLPLGEVKHVLLSTPQQLKSTNFDHSKLPELHCGVELAWQPGVFSTYLICKNPA